MTHEDLILPRYVYSSHDDYNPVESIYAGFDEKFNLIVIMEHTDYEAQEYNCASYAVIDKEDAYRLAQRLDVTLMQLPDMVAASVNNEFFEIDNPRLRDVEECFKEILECLVDEKCRFQLRRTYGKGHYSCF